jgi:hypothetical protein
VRAHELGHDEAPIEEEMLADVPLNIDHCSQKSEATEVTENTERVFTKISR